MQQIQPLQSHINQIFAEFDSIYGQLSENQSSNTLVTPHYSNLFKPLVDIFRQYGWKGDVHFLDTKFTPIQVNQPKNTIIICFSGGKDSVAVVKHYLNLGYDIHLYHLRHVNPTFHDEYKQAQKLADYYGLPIFIDDISIKGHHVYIEHPMKNMIIANGALEYGLRNNLGINIAFGNYYTSTLQQDNFSFCAGDDIEMWEIYESIINSIIPGFKIKLVLSNVFDTLNIVCEDKEILDLTVSCLGRSSLREHKHQWVKDKFSIDLPKYRCGQCYKCCLEYIYMTDYGLQNYNEDYYKYCLKKLKQNIDREDNVNCTFDDVWNHYFFYDKNKSKYFS